MIISHDESFVISSFGWVDGGSLWIFDTKSETVNLLKMSEAKYLTLHTRRNDYFAVLHHYDGDIIEITAQSFLEPQKLISKISISPTGERFDGDLNVWSMLPKTYVGYLKRPSKADFYLFLIDPVRPSAEIIDLQWYDDSYDKGYQGIIDVIEISGTEKVIISVQRNSQPVIFDLSSRQVIRKISLANRSGNPLLRFRKLVNELWAQDYDTLLRLDPSDWEIKDSLLLQGGTKGLNRQFIGDFSFNNEETLCAVARPFSGDIVALDMKRFRITHRCEIGNQPLEAVILSDKKICARDWKTGKLLNGILKRRWFA